MERLAELAAIPLREELAGWHIRICVGVPNVFSPVSKGNQKKLLVRNICCRTFCPLLTPGRPECVKEGRSAVVVQPAGHRCHRLLPLHLPHLGERA